MSNLSPEKARLSKLLRARLRARSRLVEMLLLDGAENEPVSIIAELQALIAEINFFQIQIFELNQETSDELSKQAGHHLYMELSTSGLSKGTDDILKLSQAMRASKTPSLICHVEPIRRVK